MIVNGTLGTLCMLLMSELHFILVKCLKHHELNSPCPVSIHNDLCFIPSITYYLLHILLIRLLVKIQYMKETSIKL